MQYVKFCTVGVSGMGVDMLLIHVLASPNGLHWNLTLSKIIAVEAAILNNFFWNDLWTFRNAAVLRGCWSRWFGRLARFNGICLIGMALSVFLLNAQVQVLHWNLYLANLVAIVVVSLWNFLLSQRLLDCQ